MQQSNPVNELLNMLSVPAFSVTDGTVAQANEYATQRQIAPGMEITPLLHTGNDAYESFTDGRLHLQLCVADTLWNASVTKALGVDIFLMEDVVDSQDLRILSLAALQLRSSLAEISLLSDRLNKDDALKDSDIPEKLNRSLMSMQRLIGNMADAPRYSNGHGCHMQTKDMTAFVREILEKSKYLFESAGYQLNYTLPEEAHITVFSTDRMERAIYNLLSNAIKFSPKGGVITAKLEKCGKQMLFTVCDEGPGLPENMSGNIFMRYLRKPGIEDSRMGMGLGMLFVCATASVHDGTVLIRQIEGKGLSVTMSIAIQPAKPGTIRSDIYRLDYSGGHDHALLELSDSLPTELYKR